MTMKTIYSIPETTLDKNTLNKNGVCTIRNSGDCENGSFKAQKIRWLMLTIFICFSFINSVQWGQYIIISNFIQRFYGVSGSMVDNTSVAYMLAYIPLIFPALWLLEKKGVRFCLLLSCGGLCAGAWIKVLASINKDFFYLVLVGQGVVAVFQVLAFGLAAKVAAKWFSACEVSLACALAVFGDQFGTAIGFIVPTIMVDGETDESIKAGLIRLNLVISITTTFILIVAFIFFLESPSTPPSPAQALADAVSTKNNMFKSIKEVLTQKSFIVMMVAYGISTASFNSYFAVLNSVFVKYFPDVGEIHVGMISFLATTSGIVGSILFGWLFDKTHMYKALTLLLYVCAVIVTAANIFVPQQLQLSLVYLSNILIGFFMIAYYSVAIQLAIEITFPVCESLVSSLLLLASHFLGILFTKLYRELFSEYGHIHADAFICGALTVGCLLTALIPAKLNRLSANTSPSVVDDPPESPAPPQ